jgi:hypothetical protein
MFGKKWQRSVASQNALQQQLLLNLLMRKSKKQATESSNNNTPRLFLGNPHKDFVQYRIVIVIPK